MQRKRRSHSVRKSQFDVRSVDEITEEDLENIAYRSKDKIWDKEKVRLFRLTQGSPWSFFSLPGFATVYVCFVSAGQLMSPVQAEDSGH